MSDLLRNEDNLMFCLLLKLQGKYYVYPVFETEMNHVIRLLTSELFSAIKKELIENKENGKDIWGFRGDLNLKSTAPFISWGESEGDKNPSNERKTYNVEDYPSSFQFLCTEFNGDQDNYIFIDEYGIRGIKK